MKKIIISLLSLPIMISGLVLASETKISVDDKIDSIKSWDLYVKKVIIKNNPPGQYIVRIFKEQTREGSATLIMTRRLYDNTEKVLQIFDWNKKQERFVPFFIGAEIRESEKVTYKMEDAFVIFNHNLDIAGKNYHLVIWVNPHTGDEKLQIYSGSDKKILQELMWEGYRIIDYGEPRTLGKKIEVPKSLDAWKNDVGSTV